MMIKDYGTVTDKRIALGVIGGVLVAYVLYGVWYHGRVWMALNFPPEPSIEVRIMRGCEREFGLDGPELVKQCMIRLYEEEMTKIHLDKLDRARR